MFLVTHGVPASRIVKVGLFFKPGVQQDIHHIEGFLENWNIRAAKARCGAQRLPRYVHIALHPAETVEWFGFTRGAWRFPANERCSAAGSDFDFVRTQKPPRGRSASAKYRILKIVCRAVCGFRYGHERASGSGKPELQVHVGIAVPRRRVPVI